MQKRFVDQVVVVTGGAGVVASVTARMFLEEGAKVVIGDSNKHAATLVGEWNAEGFESLFVQTDITRPYEVERLMKTAVEQYGRIDVLYSAAAVHKDDPCDKLSPEDWQSLIAVNLTGTFYANKFALQQMLRQGGGTIVNSGSVFSLIGNQDLTAYSAAMGGIKTMTQSIAVTYADKGIRANTVCPGTIDSPTVGELTGKTREQLIAEHPIGRLGKPEEVARCVLFLASEKASFVSGAELVVDGAYKSK